MGSQRSKSLTETQGISKPTIFDPGDHRKFLLCSFKLKNFIISAACKIARACMEWAGEETVMTTSIEMGMGMAKYDDAYELNERLFTLPAQLCEGEALDMVMAQ